MGKLNCIFCNETIPDGSAWCQHCGASQKIVAAQPPSVENTANSASAESGGANRAGTSKMKMVILIVILSVFTLAAVI
jgi:hypothetical protein